MIDPGGRSEDENTEPAPSPVVEFTSSVGPHIGDQPRPWAQQIGPARCAIYQGRLAQVRCPGVHVAVVPLVFNPGWHLSVHADVAGGCGCIDLVIGEDHRRTNLVQHAANGPALVDAWNLMVEARTMAELVRLIADGGW